MAKKVIVNKTARPVYGNFIDGKTHGRFLFAPGVNKIPPRTFKLLSEQPGFVGMLDNDTLSMDKADVKEAKAIMKEAKGKAPKAPPPEKPGNSNSDAELSLESSMDGAAKSAAESNGKKTPSKKGK